MTIFTDRDLERMASLRVNWRKEFLLEVLRLRRERNLAKSRDRLPSAEAGNIRSSAVAQFRGPRSCVRCPTYPISN
jgi:hypothetical protein